MQLPAVFDLNAMAGAGGQLGELAHMNSTNPVLYIQFAQGRIKLRGTVCFSGNSVMALAYNDKKPGPLICKGPCSPTRVPVPASDFPVTSFVAGI